MSKPLWIHSVWIAMIAAASLHAAASGEEVYRRICQGCHELGDTRAPGPEQLAGMSPKRILRTLDFGAMMTITYMLNRDERVAVANYLGKAKEANEVPATAFCPDKAVKLPDLSAKGRSQPEARASSVLRGQMWNGWSAEPGNKRYQSAMTLEQVKNLKLKWAFGFDGDVNAFAPPAVLDDDMFLGSASGEVHALDAKSGCMRWTFQADGPVRTAMVVARTGSRNALLFGDQTGWFYSVDATTGKQLWKKKPEEHEATKLTGSPLVHNGVVYVPTASWEEGRPQNPQYECCTFRGSVVAYEIATGKQLWKTFMVEQTPRELGRNKQGVRVLGPSGAGIWSAPTLDAKRGVLYVTTGNNYSSEGIRGKDDEPCVGDDDDAPKKGPAGAFCGKATPYSDAVVALNLKTGKIVWGKQVTPHDVFTGRCATAGDCPGPDFDFGSSVILETINYGDRASKDVLLAGQKSGVVYGMDPDNKGAILWQLKVGRGSTNGGVQWGMASDGQQVYAAVSDIVRVRKSGADPLDFRTGIDPAQGGGLTAIRIRDGQKAWFAAPPACPATQSICSPAQPSAVTAVQGAVFSGSVDGHMRAFAAEDGKIVWDFDTAREFPTVNGVKARGGSIDGAGPVIAGGMVYVVSGYARNGGMAGNVLLAFSAE